MQPTLSLPIALALILSLAACGDAPEKFGREGYQPAAHGPDDGHNHGAAPAAASWTGEIVLTGERAKSESAILMVSLVSKGQRMPRLAYRIPMANVNPAVNGVRRVPFRLDESSDMLGGGLPPELADTELELSVRFDLDGMVETKEGDITVAVPVGWGGSGIEVVVGG